jgi:pullulanase
VFANEDTGFVSGKTGLENLVATNLMGCDNTRKGIAANGHCSNGKADTNYAGADQVVQYAEIHDNLTLYDKLKLSVPDDDEATLVRRAKLADSAIFLSQGITDMQLGQEFLRTKSGNGNSYNAGDAVNAIQWDRTAQYRDSVDYVKGLIALRRQIKALHMTSYADIAANMTILSEAKGVVSYQLKSDDGTYVMIFNANNKKVSDKAVPAGTYAVLAADGSVDLTGKETTEVTATGYEASGLSATVLKQRSDTAPTDDTHTGGSAGGDNHTGIKPQNGHSNAPHAARGNGEASPTATHNRRARIVRTGASVAVIAAALTGLTLLGIALTMLTRRNPQQ